MYKVKITSMFFFVCSIVSTMFLSAFFFEHTVFLMPYYALMYLLLLAITKESPKSFLKLDDILILLSLFIVPEHFKEVVLLVMITVLKVIPPILYSFYEKLKNTDEYKLYFNHEWFLYLVFGLVSIKLISICGNWLEDPHLKLLVILFILILKALIVNFKNVPKSTNRYCFANDLSQNLYMLFIVYLALDTYSKMEVVYLTMLLATFKAIEIASQRFTASTISLKHIMQDDLTGALTKSYLRKKMDDLIIKNEYFSLIMIDLNDFKLINDEYGHVFGDKALSHFAQTLISSVRGEEVFRYGGDEFCILILGKVKSKEIIERIIDMVELFPFTLGDVTVQLKASYGAYDFNGENVTVDDVIQMADKNMYIMKKE